MHTIKMGVFHREIPDLTKRHGDNVSIKMNAKAKPMR
jgi:hypothetical protein